MIKLKALNIRDYHDNPEHRKAMGFFKHTAYSLKMTQAELLQELMENSISKIYKRRLVQLEKETHEKK